MLNWSGRTLLGQHTVRQCTGVYERIQMNHRSNNNPPGEGEIPAKEKNKKNVYVSCLKIRSARIFLIFDDFPQRFVHLPSENTKADLAGRWVRRDLSSLRSKRFQSSYCAKVRAEAKKGWRGRGRGEEETLARKPHDSGKRPLIFHGSIHL